MKYWTLLFIILTLSKIASANEMPPLTRLNNAPLIAQTSRPITPVRNRKAPPSEMMENKHIAAVVIGTAATIIIGLLVSGNDSGKHPTAPR